MLNQLKVLKQIAQRLNDHHITWQLGASCMLYLRGYVDHFHDIDIMIAENDVEQTIKIMQDLGTPIIEKLDSTYKTKVFLAYRMDEVAVDIMAGFIIVSQGQDHYFPLHQDEPCDIHLLEGVPIKLASVDTWLHYYTLMGRTDKVELIRQKQLKK